MHRIAWIVLVSGLLLTLVFLSLKIFESKKAPGPALPDAPSETPTRVAPPAVPPARLSVGPVEEQSAEATQAPLPEGILDANEPLLARGTVRGLVIGFDGLPLARAGVLFENQEGEHSSTRADERGEYEIQLHPGSWQAFYAGTQGKSGNPASVKVGTVLVQAGMDHLLDIFLQGRRRLAGGLYLTDLDNVLLETELLLASDDRTSIARVFCITSTQDREEYLSAIEAENDVPRQRLPHPPGIGYFELEGLPPDHYLLRAYLDVGKRFHVTIPIDLVHGDQSFEPIALTQQDFLQRKTIHL